MTAPARRGDPPVLRLLAALLVVFLLAPFGFALPHLVAADWQGADRAAIGRAAGVSVLSATLSTLLVSAGGIPLGFLLARGRSRVLRAVGLLVQLPLALPPLSCGVLLLFLFGYASPLGRLLGGGLTDSFAGVVLAEAFVSAPFLVVAARSAFAAMDPALPEVAATLGLSPGRIVCRICLPACARPILAGAVLCWLRAFGEFGATVMVAYHPATLPVLTFTAFGGEGLPAMLPVITPTLLAALLAMAGLALLSRPGRIVPVPQESLPEPITGVGAGTYAEPAIDAPPMRLRVRKQLDGFALHLDWTATARRLAILGASGSGKSMTLRAIAGLDAAELLVGPRDLSALPPQARNIGFVPQGFGLFPHLRVRAQLGIAPDADGALARVWSARLGLDPLLDRLPAALSLGQQQRVALARALCRRDAALLLLDEPFSALDAPLRRTLRVAFRQLQRETGLRTILVTHDPDEAMELADELLLIENGRALQSGPVDAVFARPASERAALLLGATQPARGEAVAPDRIAIGDGVTLRVSGPPLVPGPVGWAVRPAQVRLGAAEGYPARLLRRDPVCAGQRRVRIRLGDTELEIAADADAPGEGECRVGIDPAAIQVWRA